MKQTIKVILIFLFGFFASFCISSLYLGKMFHMSEDKSHLVSEDAFLKPGLETIGQATDTTAKEFLLHFSKRMKNATAKEQFYLKVLIEGLVANDCENTALFLKSLSPLPEKYIHSFFFALARHHPDKFEEYLCFFEKEKSYLVKQAFYTSIVECNPELAMKMKDDMGIEDLWELDPNLVLMNPSYASNEWFLVRKIANGDYHGFFSLAEKNTPKEYLPKVAYELFKTMICISEDVDFLQKMALEAGLEHLSEWNIHDLMKKLVRKDPEEAMLFAMQFEGVKKEQAVASVLVELTDFKSTSEMRGIIENLSDGLIKETVSRAFFEKYYDNNPEEAIAWMVKENRVNDVMFSLFGKVQSDSKVAVEFAEILLKNPSSEKIVSYVAMAFYVQNPRAGEILAERLSGNLQKNFVENYYRFWKQSSSDKAKEIAAKYPSIIVE